MINNLLSNDLVASLYLISGVFFILGIRGLSSPETARAGNYLSMSGMALAFIVTIFSLSDPSIMNLILILAGISIGGLIGTILSKRVAMTDMPQMVAALNSMGGLSAVLVAWAAFLSPIAFELVSTDGSIKTLSKIKTTRLNEKCSYYFTISSYFKYCYYFLDSLLLIFNYLRH